MGRKWRAIDIEIIRNNLHMTNSELADALNRTAAAVQCKKKKLHLKMPIRYIQQETAWNKLNHAIGRGDIQRGQCVVCGKPNADAHHVDYSKPLDVIWLCHMHHLMLHIGIALKGVDESET